MSDLGGAPLFQDYSIKVYSAIPEKCFLMKSSTTPMRIAFSVRKFPKDWTEKDILPPMEVFYTLVKTGEDVRQDQVVV